MASMHQAGRPDVELEHTDVRAQNDILASDAEKLLFERLTEHDRDLGQIFYSALFVLRGHASVQSYPQDARTDSTVDANSDRMAQSAHGIRETLSVAGRMMLPEIRDRTDGEDADPTSAPGADSDRHTNAKNIQLLSDHRGRLPDYLSGPYKALNALNQWFVAVSHHGKRPTEQEYSEKLGEFTRAMNRILEPYFETIEQIDALLKNPTPRGSDLAAIEDLTSKSWYAYSHFFRNASAAWLDVLIQRGTYFADVPEFVSYDGGYKSTPWPESVYLARVAEEKPEQVMNAILQVSGPKAGPKNPPVLADFANAASKMPPKFAKRIADKAIRELWHYNPGPYPPWTISDAIGTLVENLAAEEFDTALKLCERLLYLDKDCAERVQGYLSDYNYQLVLERLIPVLSERGAGKTLDMLCRRLSGAAKMKSDRAQTAALALSSSWHRDIKDSSYMPPSVESSLVVAVRNALEGSEKTGIDSLAESLKSTESYTHPIFARIRMHFYARHPSYFAREIVPLASSKFDVEDFDREYSRMIQYGYRYFDDGAKRALRKKISAGPGPRADGSALSETDRQRWTLEKLSVLRDAEEFKQEYESLKNSLDGRQLGRPVDGAPPAVRSGSALGSGMSPEEVIRFLQSYKPGGYYDQTRYTFKRLVSENPAEYSSLASGMSDLPPVFLRGFFDALSDADDALEWGPVLELCRLSLDNAHTPNSLDFLMAGCGAMLRKNLVTGRIPPSLHEEAWRVLDRAATLGSSDLCMPDTPESDDAFIKCINSGMGQTALAIIQYSVWRYGTDGQAPGRIAKEAEQTLESLLDRPPSSLVHAALGYGFASLASMDKAWASSHADAIFSRGHPSGDAAWESYLRKGVHPDSFNVLYREYLYRLDATSNPQTLTMMANHVVAAHLNCLGRTDELIDSIIKRKDDRLTSHLISQMGKSAYRWPDDGPKADMAAFASRKDVLANPSAGWLFLNRHLGDKARLDLLESILDATDGELDPAYLVIEALESTARSHPARTAECMWRLVSRYKAYDEILGLFGAIENTIQTALDSQNAEAEQIVRRMANDLGAYGFERFKKFS